MKWEFLLDPKYDEQAHNIFWEIFIAMIRIKCNFGMDIKLQLHAKHDLIPNTEPVKLIPLLSAHILELHRMIWQFQELLFPKEILENCDDPEAKNRRWNDGVEPNIEYIVDSQEYLIVGIAMYLSKGECKHTVHPDNQWIVDAGITCIVSPAKKE